MPAIDLSGFLSHLDLGANVHLLAATASHEGAGCQVKVVVDTPEGVTVDQIARIGKLLRSDPGLAQRLNPAGGGGTSPDYRIEVTSPGVAAGLERPWQYPRHMGRRLKVRLEQPRDQMADPVQITGRLVSIGSDGIELETPVDRRVIAWEQIATAKVVLNW